MASEPADDQAPQQEGLYDDFGRLREPDGQVVELRGKADERVVALMPSRAYVEARSVRYRTLAAIGLAVSVAGCLVHWLATRRGDVGGYLIAVGFAAVGIGLATRIWNATMRAAIVLTIRPRLRLKVATVKLNVNTRLGEKLGLARSPDGRFWQVYHVDRGRARLKLKLSAVAFPDLPTFFRDTLGDMWTDVPQP